MRRKLNPIPPPQYLLAPSLTMLHIANIKCGSSEIILADRTRSTPRELFSRGIIPDMEIVCAEGGGEHGRKRFPVHRIVLIAASPILVEEVWNMPGSSYSQGGTLTINAERDVVFAFVSIIYGLPVHFPARKYVDLVSLLLRYGMYSECAQVLDTTTVSNSSGQIEQRAAIELLLQREIAILIPTAQVVNSRGFQYDFIRYLVNKLSSRDEEVRQSTCSLLLVIGLPSYMRVRDIGFEYGLHKCIAYIDNAYFVVTVDRVEELREIFIVNYPFGSLSLDDLIYISELPLYNKSPYGKKLIDEFITVRASADRRPYRQGSSMTTLDDEELLVHRRAPVGILAKPINSRQL